MNLFIIIEFIFVQFNHHFYKLLLRKYGQILRSNAYAGCSENVWQKFQLCLQELTL